MTADKIFRSLKQELVYIIAGYVDHNYRDQQLDCVIMRIFIYTTYLLLAVTSSSVYAFTYNLEITEQELQEKIQQKMPIQKTKYFVTVTLSEPKVVLMNGSDRIDIESNIKALIPGDITAKGRGNIEGTIEYVQQSGEFYFTNPEVRSLNIENVAVKYQASIRKVADIAAKSALKRFPIYRFKDDNLKQELAKAVLKAVHVENGKLILELGI